MKQRLVKARKDHKCEGCNEGIKKGERYELLEARVPKYKNDDDEAGQIGVEFLRYKTCFRCWTTNLTHSPAFLDIVWNNKICIGQAVCEESGFWVFHPNDKSGYYESHTLIQIAALLDRLNAPFEKQLAVQFETCVGGCDFVLERDMEDNGAPTGDLVCTNCGTVKPTI